MIETNSSTATSIAIITLYDDYNIGNKLQNYALQEMIKSLGYTPETIDTHSFERWRIGWKGWIVILVGFPRTASQYKRMMLKRKRRFRAFSRKNLIVRGPISYRAIQNGALKKYDAFVCGSDQVWHNWTKRSDEMDYFFLRFTDRGKRICFAPSFGFDDVSKEKVKLYQEGLAGFDRLSCRERSGCELIFRLTGREAEQLCDPTMLLTVEQWDQIALKPDCALPEGYLLVYFLGTKEEQVLRKITWLSKKLGLTVINVFSTDFNRENDPYFCIRPDEFLYLVKHAAYICTDSFHGAVFSILYHKNFTIFQRSGADGSMMYGRLQSLLSLFHLEQCGDASLLGQNVDFMYADAILKEQREKGKHYLQEAIATAISQKNNGVDHEEEGMRLG